jgi:hypothetical protein
MELTRQQIVTLSKCGNTGVCALCFRNRECHLCAGDAIVIRAMAAALIVEKTTKRGIASTTEKEQSVKCGGFLRDVVLEKYDAYTEKERDIAVMAWDHCLTENGITVIQTKSRIDEIAEEAVSQYAMSRTDRMPLVEVIKAAIMKDRETRIEG